jgi:hypothetical protein
MLGASAVQTFARPTRIDCLFLENPIEENGMSLGL